MKNFMMRRNAGAAAVLAAGLLTAHAQLGGTSWADTGYGGYGELGGYGGYGAPGVTLLQEDGDGVVSSPKLAKWTTLYNEDKKPHKEVAWLGLAFDESSDALAAQLGLKPGEGLTVNFVAADSPAAKADFRTNDVLVEFDGQMLVHPMQLRKLIQVSGEGESVKLTFFRAGEKQTVSVKLGKTDDGQDGAQGVPGWPGVLSLNPTSGNVAYTWNGNGGVYASGYGSNGKKSSGKDVTWMGVVVEEASEDEALIAQLGLKPGQGLTVSQLAADGPATQAGFHTNDVLTEFDGQMLVHPMQLRKLVQMHADGDAVTVEYYRGGKRQTATLKLAKATEKQAAAEERGEFAEDHKTLNYQLSLLGNKLAAGTGALGQLKLDDDSLHGQLARSMEQARKTIQDAARQMGTNETSLLGLQQKLEAMGRGAVNNSADATVIVRNKSGASRTIVQTDDDGTLIIAAGDKAHLTARDKTGKVLFEGDVDTAEEKAKVPKEVWEKAKPLLDQVKMQTGGKVKDPLTLY